MQGRNLKKLARHLRKSQTNAEGILWGSLRAKRLLGIKFRRQVPLAGYVVDFLAPNEKLIIELDGGQHLGSTNDVNRTASLEKEGYRVMRFWDHDVLLNLEAVLTAIGEALQPPSPRPSPLKGEGDRPRQNQ